MSHLLDSGHVGNIVTKLRTEFPNITEEEIINHVIDKWKNTGLLDGLNGTFKKLVAFKLEELATLLINYPEYGDRTNGRIDTLAFPIVRRMINEFTDFSYSLINGWGYTGEGVSNEYFERNLMLYEILDVNLVVSKIVNSFDSSLVFVKDLLGDNIERDNEAEACALLATQISNYHKHLHRNHVLHREVDGSIKVIYNRE
jgi:hypothetical protein